MCRRLLMVTAVWVGLLAGVGAAEVAKQGQKCGGFIGIECEDGLWCQKPAGQCGVADGYGTCAKAPEICNQVYRPVCGCDGKTYGNDCELRMHKVSKAHDGPCK